MFKWPWQSRHRETQKRYAAARLSRYVDFFNALQSAHRQRLQDLGKLRAHSRELTNDNVYAARYAQLVSTNLVGPDGIHFESEIVDAKGNLREDQNSAIEAAYTEFCQCCTVDGRLSMVEASQLAAETTAVDGEILVRLVCGFPNKWGFAIELIDADRLDHTYSTPLRDGSRIVGGVEVDSWGRRLAYHLWSVHPDDYDSVPRRVRIPADQILHIYREDRTQGFRGIPWGTPCMVQVNMLGRLWTAELAAANYDADRVAVIKPQAGLSDAEYNLDDAQATATELTSDHATVWALDAGQDMLFPQSNHPNSVLPQFTAFLLKGLAAGYGVAHHSLSADLSESKFSSDRTGLLAERDHWRKLQGWFIRAFCDPIYRAWLEMAVLSGALRLQTTDVEKLYAPRWDGRTWDWVDPNNDIKASTTAIAENLSTLQLELGARGLNWREVLKQRAVEQDYIASLKPKDALPAANGENASAVQDTALNGAQVTSLLEIINAVAAGDMPKATAKPLILAAFPGITEAQVEAMLAPIKEGSAKPAEPVNPPPAKETGKEPTDGNS